MKKRFTEMMIVILCLILPQAALSLSDDRYTYLWNNEGLYVPLYNLIDDCLSNHETRYYILNGAHIDDSCVENIGNGVSKIHLDEAFYFFRAEYLCDSMTDPFYESNSNWITNKNAFTISEYNVYKNFGTEKYIDIIGIIQGELVILDKGTIGFIRLNTLLISAICQNPLWGMISEEDAICFAQRQFEKEFSEFDRSSLLATVSLVGYIDAPESSYYYILFFPENDWQNVYIAVVDAIDGTIRMYDYAEETNG